MSARTANVIWALAITLFVSGIAVQWSTHTLRARLVETRHDLAAMQAESNRIAARAATRATLGALAQRAALSPRIEQQGSRTILRFDAAGTNQVLAWLREIERAGQTPIVRFALALRPNGTVQGEVIVSTP